MTELQEHPAVAVDVLAAIGHVLPQSSQSAALARDIVGTALAGLPADTVSTAQMLTSELVTNAVQHAQSMSVLHVTVAGHRLWVEVEDLSFDLPLPRQPSPDAEDGRGLLLLAELASAWGWDRTPAGKLVWFELPTGS